MPVNGIGGFFFRSLDPEKLAAWYKQHLGIEGGDTPWNQSAGPTIFAPFKAHTDYFAADKQFMLNLRVSDLDALVGELQASGIPVIRKAEWDDGGFGKFARIHDPEGNAIELWEPAPE